MVQALPPDQQDPQRSTNFVRPADTPSVARQFSELNFAYRPFPGRDYSVLPADPDSGLHACFIETRKDLKEASGQPYSRTEMQQNFLGNRLCLTVDYMEREKSGDSSMRATLSINGEQVGDGSIVRIANRVNFPFVIRESDISTVGCSLKEAIHEGLHQFRLKGDVGFLSYFGGLLKPAQEIDPVPYSDIPVAKDFALIGNVFDYLNEDFAERSHGTSFAPQVHLGQVPQGNISLQFYHDSGISMTLNILCVRSSQGSTHDTFLPQQLRVVVPGEGIVSKLPFIESQERHFVDIHWDFVDVDMRAAESQIKSVLQSYNTMVDDASLGKLARVAEYFKDVPGYHATFAENMMGRLGERSRPLRKNGNGNA